MAGAGRSSSDLESLYFELQSDFGITKHMGGRKATDELIELAILKPAVRQPIKEMFDAPLDVMQQMGYGLFAVGK